MVAAKRSNERVRLFATTANIPGLGILATAAIVPNFGQPPATVSPFSFLHPWWTVLAAFLVLFLVALTA